MTPQRPPRLFVAEDIVAGRVSLDGYPFRFIVVSIKPGLGAALSGAAAHIDIVFTACEILESRGWEVVNFDANGLMAHLRRRSA